MLNEKNDVIESDKKEIYIAKLEFNNGKTVVIKQNDIVVFVGPNNAGKSQALKDIYTLGEKKMDTIVINDIVVEKNNTSILSILESMDNAKDNGNYSSYNVMGQSYNIDTYTDSNFLSSKNYGQFRDLLMINLNTEARLVICNASGNINRDEIKRHPIQYAAFEGKYGDWLSKNFKKAFGTNIMTNILYGSTIPLCIGEPIILEDMYANEQERQYEYGKRLAAYKQVDKQGDGIRSFTGILLFLMFDHYSTFLIDEPESFLHPPQANIMGRIIGETLTNSQQAFISTHSEDIIKGLIDVCPERVKIIRITREDDINEFSILDNEKFNEVWNDPLLKYSNIMASLFHKCVVLCESDSDCKMYSIIEDYLKQSAGKYSEAMFIHCGGKHRMAKIITALRALDVEVKIIPDIDIMNDENIFRGLIQAYGREWDDFSTDYNIVVSNLHSEKEKIDRNDFKIIVEHLLNESKEKYLTNKEINSIKDSLRTVSKWSKLKESGISAIPRGDATEAFGRINQKLKDCGIYIVPVGELECFIKEVGGHGPEWTNKVIEKYADLEDKVYDKIKEFVNELNI